MIAKIDLNEIKYPGKYLPMIDLGPRPMHYIMKYRRNNFSNKS